MYKPLIPRTLSSGNPELSFSQINQNHYADKKVMAQPQDASKKPKRLVLCFDGTDNKYSADESDSNIVQIYELMDRESLNQYHYYQR
jgi:uncharacterized protein (DUF2235 family)